MTTEQDKSIIEANAAGIRSSRYEPGPSSMLEQDLDGFREWYLGGHSVRWAGSGAWRGAAAAATSAFDVMLVNPYVVGILVSLAVYLAVGTWAGRKRPATSRTTSSPAGRRRRC